MEFSTHTKYATIYYEQYAFAVYLSIYYTVVNLSLL